MLHQIGDLVFLLQHPGAVGIVIAVDDIADASTADHMSYINKLRYLAGARAVYYALLANNTIYGPLFGDEIKNAN